eukprot:TRINITY_DN24597_c0_g1_i1.p1 TRINITY_DN24597_c0_g1~~TRINITY_DN24597_c0_g1_i1.p1  ORF type:complete len:551 (+),score=111.34 TRINITY_DN24597_c0_g1_i1:145-1797(+)
MSGDMQISRLHKALADFVEHSENEDSAQACSAAMPALLEEVYGASNSDSALRAGELLVRACEAFISQHGDCLARIMRSPARVNLRGMHIDNNGGYTNSICVDREVMIMFKCQPRKDGDPICKLWNADDIFEPREVSVASGIREAEVSKAPGWEKYVRGAILAAEQVLGCSPTWPCSIYGVVASTCPAGAGLSSSHAFVLCALGALLNAAGMAPGADGIDPILELKAAQRAEHLAGVKSGLMDQGSMIFGRANTLLHAHFYDLQMDQIPSTVRHCAWPGGCKVVVVNSRIVRQLATGDAAVQYALPRLGCAIALPILRAEASRRGLTAEDEFSWSIDATLSLLKIVPAAGQLTELLQAFPEHEAMISAAVERFIPGGRSGLGEMKIPLRGSTLFTLAESARARIFFTALEQGDLDKCGAFMDAGHKGDDPEGQLHISDDDLDRIAAAHADNGLAFVPGVFCAGHQRLDELCDALRAAGAVGASLTGAGRGGCVVGLFSSSELANAAMATLHREFPNLQQQDIFVATPVSGRGLLNTSVLESGPDQKRSRTS